MMAMLACTARALRKTLESIATPCSVNALGKRSAGASSTELFRSKRKEEILGEAGFIAPDRLGQRRYGNGIQGREIRTEHHPLASKKVNSLFKALAKDNRFTRT